MGVFASNFDFNQIKEFFDPYPNGQVFAIPEKVKEVVYQLNGQKTSVREAVKKIMNVTSNAVSVNSEKNCICLEFYADGYVIKYTAVIIKFR